MWGGVLFTDGGDSGTSPRARAIFAVFSVRWRANSMANSISLRKTVTNIRVNNQIMQTLLEMLVFSGTAHALTDTEKNLIVFLAQLDQTYRGTGMSSFYWNELPWKSDSLFQGQVDFMIAVVDNAIARTHWDG